MPLRTRASAQMAPGTETVHYENLGHVIDVYGLLSNNCTTKVCDGLNELNSKALEIKGQKERFILPANLQGHLYMKI